MYIKNLYFYGWLLIHIYYNMPLVKLIVNILAIHHQKIIPICSLSLTIDILICGSSCVSSSLWIAHYCPIIVVYKYLLLPCVFIASLIKSLDSYQVLILGRQTSSFWYFVSLRKVYIVWFISWNLDLLEVCYLIIDSMFYFLEWDKYLSMCVLLHLLCLMVFTSFIFCT
jgi:hypothetical protein